MLSKTLSSIALAGAVVASPAHLASRQVPNYPPLSTSQGFQLVANLTAPGDDLEPSVQGLFVNSIHTGAGLNDAVLKADSGAVFYLNGTAEEIRYDANNVLTDNGAFSYGIVVQPEDQLGLDDTHEVSVNAMSATSGVNLARHPEPIASLRLVEVGQPGGMFMACNQFEPYYSTNYTTVRYSYSYEATDPSGETSLYTYIPEGCVEIKLLPQCAALEDVQDGSQASHEYVGTARCYEDVAAIEW